MMDDTKKKAHKRDADQSEVTIIGMDMDSTPTPAVTLPSRAKPKMSFEAFWVLAQRKYGLKTSMKNPIYKHFSARGFLQTGDFNAGLKDFGLTE